MAEESRAGPTSGHDENASEATPGPAAPQRDVSVLVLYKYYCSI